jgi:hypothetical protein
MKAKKTCKKLSAAKYAEHEKKAKADRKRKAAKKK